MFEHQTYEDIMQRALSSVPSQVDKRQGSLIWDALAAACAELAQMYIELDQILTLTFAQTAHGQWLEMRCAEMGVHRRQPVHAIRLGTMKDNHNQLMDIPIGSRFSIDTVNYTAIERLQQGHYKCRCEQGGVVGNQLFGRLIPVDPIRHLAQAELDEIIVPGEDRESDESLWLRYEEHVNTSPFGGNIDDYKLKTRSIEGVGDCKIYPAWNGGGTVKVVIIDSRYLTPSTHLIESVQEILDPVPFAQQGKGIAPIGHLVTVLGVEEVEINLDLTLWLSSGITIGQVADDIEAVIENYLFGLRQVWSHQDQLNIRLAQLISSIISIPGIEDIKVITINEQAQNLVLENDQIPVMGQVQFHE